jgi:tRNA threonylcarbamoyladenosine biosynthesis protein TsaB
VKLLAIDTAAEACSAALYLDGEIRSRFVHAPRRHGELILPMMDELLRDAGLVPGQLDALAFGRGPGAFTGVRIATGVVQGVAFAADLPVVPVSNLAALAQRTFREGGHRRILAAFDARMGEVYWGAYEIGDSGFAEAVGAEQIEAPERVEVPPGDGWQGAGSGWGTYPDVLRERVGPVLVGVTPDLVCHAHDVALLGAEGFAAGRAVASEQALPVYLRDRVAWAKPGA